jgi:hypothetical protein
LIAAALLIAALTGSFVQRSKPWLLGVTMAFVILNSGRDGGHRFIDLAA